MKQFALALCLLSGLVASRAATSTPAAPAAAGPIAAAPAANNGFSGKVSETMGAGDYTYIQVDTGTNKLWAAAPRFAVKVGDKVAIAAGMPMDNYHSKILNRDFEVVYFTDRVVVNGQGAPGANATLPAGHPPLGGQKALTNNSTELPAGHPPVNGAAVAKATRAKVDLTGIKKAEGGKTVSEIYAQQSKLGGKEVLVRGKVVKFNANIMGRNWLHLQDGTGTPGSDDLLVTSKTDAAVGDTVLVKGKISLKKDFGANYKYDVMIEDGTVTKE